MNRIATLIVFLLIGTSASAQNCVADTTLTNQGIYPDSATNIPSAQVGVPYDATITVVVPADTMVVLVPGGNPVQVLIDSIVLVKLLNTPAWASFACEPPSCGFPGGTSGCGRITGTPPAGEWGKDYNVGFVVTTYGRLAAFPSQQLSQTDTNEVYYILHVDFGVGQGQTLAYMPDVQLFPNPVQDHLLVQLSDPAPTKWTVSDMVGRTLAAGTSSNRHWSISVSHLEAGVYFFAVEQNGSREVLSWVKR